MNSDSDSDSFNRKLRALFDKKVQDAIAMKPLPKIKKPAGDATDAADVVAVDTDLESETSTPTLTPTLT